MAKYAPETGFRLSLTNVSHGVATNFNTKGTHAALQISMNAEAVRVKGLPHTVLRSQPNWSSVPLDLAII